MLACGTYAIARDTSAFAVREVAVEGPPDYVGAQVARALAPTRGSSLLALELTGLRADVEAIPTVSSVRFDRAFPHTLRAIVVPERPAAVFRQGRHSWLVSASGRVLALLERGTRPRLPRLWLQRTVDLEVGERVRGPLRDVVRTVAPLRRAPLPAGVATVRYGAAELTLVLRSGNEIRLGDHSDRALKLELARRILPTMTDVERYLDLSVPERPVVGTSFNSRLSTRA